MNAFVQKLWAGELPWAQWLLSPLSLLYLLGLKLHSFMRFAGLLGKPVAVGKPVVVIGNVTVGGAGKTPLTLWCVAWFKRQGLRVGILSRGYGGSARRPTWVSGDSDPRVVGDEPLLLARRSGVPVMVSRHRVQGALLLAPQVDVIVCDDGLQHWRLARDLEWAVIDGRRRFGNGWLLPVGPLRESVKRLAAVDARVCNGGQATGDEWSMCLEPMAWVRLKDGQVFGLDHLRHQAVHALAGIGDPERFFLTVEELGVTVTRHPLPDHAPWMLSTQTDAPSQVWVMTEKDAMKAPSIGSSQPIGDHWYYLKIGAKLDPSAEAQAASQLWGLWRGGGLRGSSYR
jgi:tetraacyldisaccharide 4'-kinase